MISKKSTSKRTTDTPLLCLVCGEIARGLNFDVITCMSCKAFFRRNAAVNYFDTIREFEQETRDFTRLLFLYSTNQKSLQCQSNNDCPIHKYSRSGCSACRLKKCYALGMNPQLIRSSPQNTSTTRKQRGAELRHRLTAVQNVVRTTLFDHFRDE